MHEDLFAKIENLARNAILSTVSEKYGEDLSLLYKNHAGHFVCIVGDENYIKKFGIDVSNSVNTPGIWVVFRDGVDAVADELYNSYDLNVEKEYRCEIILQSFNSMVYDKAIVESVCDISFMNRQANIYNRSKPGKKTFGGRDLNVVEEPCIIQEQQQAIVVAPPKQIKANKPKPISKEQKKLGGLYANLKKAKRSNNAALVAEIEAKIVAVKKAAKH